MNRAQVGGVIRAAVPALVAVLVGYNVIPGETSSDTVKELSEGLVGVVTVVAVVWSLVKNSHTATIDRASKSPGVQKIIADRAISDGTLKDNPKVVAR